MCMRMKVHLYMAVDGAYANACMGLGGLRLIESKAPAANICCSVSCREGVRAARQGRGQALHELHQGPPPHSVINMVMSGCRLMELTTLAYKGVEAEMKIEWIELSDNIRADKDVAKRIARPTCTKPCSSGKRDAGEMQG